jgi:hypothetical protein
MMKTMMMMARITAHTASFVPIASFHFSASIRAFYRLAQQNRPRPS